MDNKEFYDVQVRMTVSTLNGLDDFLQLIKERVEEHDWGVAALLAKQLADGADVFFGNAHKLLTDKMAMEKGLYREDGMTLNEAGEIHTRRDSEEGTPWSHLVLTTEDIAAVHERLAEFRDPLDEKYSRPEDHVDIEAYRRESRVRGVMDEMYEQGTFKDKETIEQYFDATYGPGGYPKRSSTNPILALLEGLASALDNSPNHPAHEMAEAIRSHLIEADLPDADPVF